MGAVPSIPSPSQIERDILRGLEAPFKELEKTIIDPAFREIRKLEDIPEGLDKAFDELGKLPKHLEQAGDTIVGPFEDGLDEIDDFFKEIPGYLDDLGNNIIDPVLGFFDGIVEDILDSFNFIIDAIDDLFDDIANMFEEFGGWVEDLADDIKDFFVELGEGIVDIASDAGEFFTDMFEDVINVFTGIWEKLVSLKNFFETVWYYIRCTIKMVANFPKCMFIYVIDCLKEIVCFMIWTIFMILEFLGLEDATGYWQSVRKKYFDKHLKWSNDLMNDCFRCSNEEEKEEEEDSENIIDRLLDSIQNSFASLTRGSFFIFMLSITVILVAYYWYVHMFN